MKKLEELGISRTPWYPILYCDDWRTVFGLQSELDDKKENREIIAWADEPISQQNACMLLAAPDLYEALRKITEEQECGRDCAKCANHGCVIKECKAALAKASGEGEVAK